MQDNGGVTSASSASLREGGVKDDVLSGVLLFFGLVWMLAGAALLMSWNKTRGILSVGALVHARVTGQEVREVSEALGSPYHPVHRVNHLFVRLEIPCPDGGTMTVWHDIGAVNEARAADSYQVRYRPQAPRQYRVVGSRHWSKLGGGILFGLLGLLSVVVVIWRLSTGTHY
jgi:hypothetical protein